LPIEGQTTARVFYGTKVAENMGATDSLAADNIVLVDARIEAKRELNRRRGPFRAIAYALAGVFLLFISLSAPWPTGGVLLAFGLFVLAGGLFYWWSIGHTRATTPTSAFVTDEGVTLELRSGKSLSFRWSDPSLDFNLVESHPRGVGGPVHWLSWRKWWAISATPVTAEGAALAEALAIRHGLAAERRSLRQGTLTRFRRKNPGQS
jgi:hypothetical protein